MSIVSSITAATSASNAGSTGGSINISMLKAAQGADVIGALALIKSLPQITPAANLPSHLGQNINTTA